MATQRISSLVLAAFALIAAASKSAPAAEPIKIGIVKTLAVGPIFVAKEKGFFAAEGLDAELVYIDAAQPIAVAAASGAIDFGITGLSAAFYALAGEGVLRMIAAGNREMPGFKNAGYVASNRAANAGLKRIEDLRGHSVGVTQRGAMLDYDLALALDRFHIDPKTVRVLALQSNTALTSAIAGGQADAGVLPVTPAMVMLGKGEAKLLGWVGDIAPYGQTNAAFTSAKTADERRATVEHFLAAYKKGAQLYHDAFADAKEERRDGPGATEILAILAKYTGQDAEQIRAAIPWVDRDLRLDVADIKHQIEWFRAQGLLKGEADPVKIVDARYVVPLPRP
ncbi:MAG TPA: ABC transporter substrate-binding protein [Stellaceae bacterium]|nr:ABC transporter substrate-binding protein [Stellaceae bacterium]